MSRQDNFYAERNLYLILPVPEFLKQCKIENYQDSGKGGQKRNRKYSAVRLTHIPTNLSVTCAEHREQNINRQTSVKKLKLRIALLCSGPEIKLPRNIISTESSDYFLWIAFVLDELYKSNFEIPFVAEKLDISNTKLLKLIYRDRSLWNELNSNRIAFGKKSFRLD